MLIVIALNVNFSRNNLNEIREVKMDIVIGLGVIVFTLFISFFRIDYDIKEVKRKNDNY